MSTVDNLLLHLFALYPNFDIKEVSNQDRKILNSFYNQLQKQHFFTEKQGNLLVKLLWKNLVYIPELQTNFKKLLENPSWSQKFRIIKVMKKIYFEDQNKTHIIIEFTYDKTIREKLSKITHNNETICKSMSATIYKMKVSEYNILCLINILIKDNFDIDNEIIEIYKKIKEIVINNKKYIDILEPNNTTLLDKVMEDLDPSKDNNLILLDRRQRYQYSYNSSTTDESLTFQIANRSNTQLFISNKKYQLTDIFSSLDELKRFPTLLIFNKNEVHESLEILKNLTTINNHQMLGNIGIYYRCDNTSELHKNFNLFIQTNKFNCELNESTLIAGTASTFLPKFFYRTNWYPKSVISFTNNFKNNKVFMYCDAVDCIIYYNEHKPLVGKIDEIL